MTKGLIQIGQSSVAIEVLKLVVQDATITVRHEQREDIAVSANYPEHWEVSAGTVRQTSVRQFYSDAQIYIAVNGVDLVELFVRFWRRLFGGVPTVSTEAQVAKPAPQVEMSVGDDELLVLVPLNFAGGLDLSVEGSGECEVDTWSGGSVRIDYSSSEDLKVGAVRAVGAFVITHSSDGDVKLGDVQADSIESSFTGDGSLTLGSLNARGNISLKQENATDIEAGDITGDTVTVELDGGEDFQAGVITARERLVFIRNGDGCSTLAALYGNIVEVTMTGEGDQELGNIKAGTVKIDHDESNCEVTLKEVQSTSFTLNHSSAGSVDIAKLDTTAIHLECDGEGDVTIKAGSAQSGRVHNGGDLDVSITGRFGYISQKNDGGGSLEVEVTE